MSTPNLAFRWVPAFHCRQCPDYRSNNGGWVAPPECGALNDLPHPVPDCGIPSWCPKPKPNVWRPIAEAPKDGTAILGWKDGVRATVVWLQSDFAGDAGGYWSLLVTGAYADSGEWDPVLWYPLPRDPAPD